jgi:hypothetical protein
VLVACVTACGGSSARVTSHVRPALQKLERARTGIVTTNLAFVHGHESTPPIVYVTRFDNRSKRVETKVDLRRFIHLYNQTIPASERVGKESDWRFDVIADSSRGLVMYMSSPLFDEASFQKKLPAKVRHKQWMKISLLELATNPALSSGMSSEFLSYLPGVGSPLAYFKLLRVDTSTDGRERIDGVDTDRYRGTVNLHAHLDELPRFLQKVVERTSGKMEALVWVDGTSTVRRIELRSGAIRGGGDVGMVDTTDLHKLGSRVAILLPPRQEVYDATELRNG